MQVQPETVHARSPREAETTRVGGPRSTLDLLIEIIARPASSRCLQLGIDRRY